MYALLFRNRWLALVWVALILMGALFVATRTLSDVVEAPAAEASAEAGDAFARWASEKPEAAPAEEDGHKKVEVRIYHDAPKDDAPKDDVGAGMDAPEAADAPDDGAGQPDSDDQQP